MPRPRETRAKITATVTPSLWRLSFSGCLAITTTTPGATVLPPVSNLRLQWAPGKNGPWHTISSSIRATGSLCSHGQRFTGTASAPYNYAYYRATFLAAPSRPDTTWASMPRTATWCWPGSTRTGSRG